MKSARIAFFAIALAGCASSFHPINRNTFEYNRDRDTTSLTCQYNFNVFEESGNPFYAQKARELGIRVVAVKLKNNTDREINVQNDLDIYVGGGQANPTRPRTSLLNVRQRSGMYCWFLLMVLVNGFVTNTECTNGYCAEKVSFIPIGIILGPILALVNGMMASSANDGIMNEIANNDLESKSIKPGETVTGYLVFDDPQGSTLSVKLRK